MLGYLEYMYYIVHYPFAPVKPNLLSASDSKRGKPRPLNHVERSRPIPLRELPQDSLLRPVICRFGNPPQRLAPNHAVRHCLSEAVAVAHLSTIFLKYTNVFDLPC